MYVYDTGGELVSLPAGWTGVVAEDPFVVLAAFRAEDLLELTDLVNQIGSPRPPGRPSRVKPITS